MYIKQLSALAGLAVLTAAPVYATPYCIAVGGGFGNGGTSFVGRNFTMPAVNSCNVWTGYTKTASTVVLFSSGTACLSGDGKVLTFAITSADPSYLGSNQLASDYIQLCPKGTGATNCPIGTPRDVGAFTGNAAVETCTSALQTLPAKHD